MIHPEYGNLPHIYYHKHSDRYYVRFRRQGTYFVSPYYNTIEEAIKAKKEMQYIVPKSMRHIVTVAHQKLERGGTWYYKDYVNGGELPKGINTANLKRKN